MTSKVSWTKCCTFSTLKFEVLPTDPTKILATRRPRLHVSINLRLRNSGTICNAQATLPSQLACRYISVYFFSCTFFFMLPAFGSALLSYIWLSDGVDKPSTPPRSTRGSLCPAVREGDLLVNAAQRLSPPFDLWSQAGGNANTPNTP